MRVGRSQNGHCLEKRDKMNLSGSFRRDRVRFADEDVRVFISLVLSMQTDGGQCRFQTQIKTNVVMLCFSICLLSFGASESMEVDGLC